MDTNPLRRADLDAALKEMEQRLDQRFEGRMDVLEQRMTDRFTEAIRDSETRLLQAFYGYAETNNRRFQQSDATTAILLARVTTLENRVFECEKRLNIPPGS